MSNEKPNQEDVNIKASGENAAEESAADKEARVAAILETAFKENPSLQEIKREKLEEVVGNSLDEIATLEREARRPLDHLPKTKEEAEKIKAIWDLSGPGTYDQPFDEELYTGKDWAMWMDHHRLNRSAWLMRKLTEIIIGQEFKVEKGENISHRQELKEAIRESGPYLIYNGTEAKNTVLQDVLTRTGITIPTEKVFVIGKKITRTIDQIKQFQLPIGLELKPGDKIVVVSHAPHIARIMRMVERYHPFPKDMKVKVFPVPTPESGVREFADQEIRGILHYVFVTGDANETSYPYEF